MLDLIDAWHYKQYIINRQNAALAFDIGAVFGGKITKVEQLCGEWENNQVMTTAEAYAWRKKMRKKVAKDSGKKIKLRNNG